MNRRRITSEEIEYNLLNLKQLTIEVTDACNLKCKYCGYGELYAGYDKREAKYLDFNKIRILIDYLIDLWNKGIPDSQCPQTYISFYGGEPLLNMSLIIQVVNYIKSRNITREIVFSITTNAILLDKYIDYLVENDFHVLISIDGDRHNHSYRVDHSGNNSFDRVYNNIKLLQQKYPEFFNLNVNFNAVLHNRNTISEILGFIYSEFSKKPRIAELNTSGIRPDKLVQFNKMYRNKQDSINQSIDCDSLIQNLGVGVPSTNDLLLYLHQYSGNVFRNYNDLLVDPDKIQHTPTGTCSPFSKKMFLTVNGKILQCERIDHSFALGFVSDSGVEIDTELIAHKFNTFLDLMQKQCSQCYRKNNCSQCVYYIPKLISSNPTCNAFMDKSAFKLYESYCLTHLQTHPYLYDTLMRDVHLE